MNKQIIIAVLIFLAIAVVGAGVYFGDRQKANNADNPASQLEGQPKETSKNALPQVKKLSCEDIIDAKEKENCSVGVKKLLNSDSSSVCQGLISEADKSTCRQSYFVKEAAHSGDLNKCKEAASAVLTADCSAQASFSLAIQKKDKKYCENIINKTDKESCFKVLSVMGVK